MTSTAALLVAEETTKNELAIPPWMVGVIALLAFAFLLGVTWSFRGTHHKYATPTVHDEDPGKDMPHWPEHPGHH
jgi:hypothetical protein